MKLAIYGKALDPQNHSTVKNLIDLLAEMDIGWCVEKDYSDKIREIIDPHSPEIFSDREELIKANVDFLLSLGGDGTLLETLLFTQHTSIPVIGVNLGRLGFLS